MAGFNERFYYNPFLSDPLCKQTEKSETAEAVETVYKLATQAQGVCVTFNIFFSQVLADFRPRALSVIEAEIPAVLAEHTNNTRDQSVYTGVTGKRCKVSLNDSISHAQVLFSSMFILHQPSIVATKSAVN